MFPTANGAWIPGPNATVVPVLEDTHGQAAEFREPAEDEASSTRSAGRTQCGAARRGGGGSTHDSAVKTGSCPRAREHMTPR